MRLSTSSFSALRVVTTELDVLGLKTIDSFNVHNY